jgi:hypothetical protein
MASPEHLQRDMFSGEWVDNRSAQQKRQERQAQQPQQHELFPQREIAQFGVRAHPQFSLSQHTHLVLVSEDPRTPEERERDLQREAEQHTYPLFGDESEGYQDVDTQEEQDAEGDSLDNESATTDEPPPQPKLSVYLELVQWSEERAATVWIDPRYEGAYEAQLGLLVAEAQRAGLSAAEIITAIKIGNYRGNVQKQQLR